MRPAPIQPIFLPFVLLKRFSFVYSITASTVPTGTV
jgi:hypothetical protein